MLKAELAGKLSGDESTRPLERLEDILTSNVFGALLYADASDLLVAWLGMAKNQLGNPLAERLPAPPSEAALHFWPRMRTRAGVREPDLLVMIKGTSGSDAAICVEAKFDAGPSDHEPDEDPIDGSTLAGDQLRAQFDLLKEGTVRTRQEEVLTLPDPHRRFHVFLTAHWARPAEMLDGYARDSAMASDMYWLNWHALTVKLRDERNLLGTRPGARILLADLRDLLKRKRLDLTDFEGWHGLPSGPCRCQMRWLADVKTRRPVSTTFSFADLGPGPCIATCSRWMEDSNDQ